LPANSVKNCAEIFLFYRKNLSEWDFLFLQKKGNFLWLKHRLVFPPFVLSLFLPTSKPEKCSVFCI
jgi:hypothetical protein